VAHAEGQGLARIFGLGVGLDLSPYYANSHVLELADGVGMAHFRELMGLLAHGGRR